MNQLNTAGIKECFPDSSETFPAETKNGKLSVALEELRHELIGGLLYTHSRANSNTNRILEAASFLYALIEILKEKGIITIEELDERNVKVGSVWKSGFSARAWA